MNVAIIAAGGRGARMGGERAKQFLELSGKPVIIHTLMRFEACSTLGEIVVVVPSSETKTFLEIAARFSLKKLARVVAGGETRAESVWRGLQSVRAATTKIVAVHDAARPLVTPEEIDRTVREAERSGAAILAAPVVDTIKEVEGGKVAQSLERSRLWRAQTPQCFRYEILRRAYEEALSSGSLDATDDSALVERIGREVAIVEGGERNLKITTPRDLVLAEILLKGEGEAFRRTENS